MYGEDILREISNGTLEFHTIISFILTGLFSHFRFIDKYSLFTYPPAVPKYAGMIRVLDEYRCGDIFPLSLGK